MTNKKTWAAFFMVFTGTLAPLIGAPISQAAEADQTAETRTIMAGIFTSLTRVLTLSMRQDTFTSVDNRKAILQDLEALSRESSTLVKHVAKFEPSYGYIAKSLGRDFNDIYGRYKSGSYSEARFLLHQVPENCSSCHLKLPDPGHAPNLEMFFKNVEIAKLDQPEVARLQISLRQFDSALETWEKMFESWKSPNEILVMDSLTDYLKVCIRVKKDPKRAAVTLGKISQKLTIPAFMKREMTAWEKSLQKLNLNIKDRSARLENARKLIDSAKNGMDYPLDRRGYVDFIAASLFLNEFLNDNNPTPVEKSEANYLLGVTERLIGRGAWISQVAFYFETSVRAAPGSKYAGLAFDALEQTVINDYSGSSGTDVPEDIRENLRDLQQLMAKEKKK